MLIHPLIEMNILHMDMELIYSIWIDWIHHEHCLI